MEIDGLSQFITVFGIGRLCVLYLELDGLKSPLHCLSVLLDEPMELNWGGIFGQSQLPPLWEIHCRLHVRAARTLVRLVAAITIHDNSE